MVGRGGRGTIVQSLRNTALYVSTCVQVLYVKIYTVYVTVGRRVSGSLNSWQPVGRATECVRRHSVNDRKMYAFWLSRRIENNVRRTRIFSREIYRRTIPSPGRPRDAVKNISILQKKKKNNFYKQNSFSCQFQIRFRLALPLTVEQFNSSSFNAINIFECLCVCGRARVCTNIRVFEDYF